MQLKQLNPLIEVTDLRTLCASGADVLIVDCRHHLTDPDAGPQAYAQGHLPGAVFVHLDRDLAAPHGAGLCGGRHPLPARESLRLKLQALGLSDSTQLIAYDADGGAWAARLWWLALWLGHERVAVLDGGLPAWVAAGQPLSANPPSARQGKLSLRTPVVSWVDADTVAADVAGARRLIIDARAPMRFSGAQEPIDPVAGHIPGAVNRFWQNNLDPSQCFLPAPKLRSSSIGAGGGGASVTTAAAAAAATDTTTAATAAAWTLATAGVGHLITPSGATPSPTPSCAAGSRDRAGDLDRPDWRARTTRWQPY